MLFPAEIQGVQNYRSCCSCSFTWTCMNSSLLSLQITAQFILNYHKIKLCQKIFHLQNCSSFNSCHIFGINLLTLKLLNISHKGKIMKISMLLKSLKSSHLSEMICKKTFEGHKQDISMNSNNVHKCFQILNHCIFDVVYCSCKRKLFLRLK